MMKKPEVPKPGETAYYIVNRALLDLRTAQDEVRKQLDILRIAYPHVESGVTVNGGRLADDFRALAAIAETIGPKRPK